MAGEMDKQEFKFPDEGGDPATKEGVVTDAEIEIVDDTPEQDRNRAPLGKTADEIAPDDEVAQYGEKVQERIKQLKRSFHDERREKETAARERDEAVKSARYFYEQAQKANQTVQQTQKVNVEQMKAAATAELATAERDLETAYESGDAKAVVKASKALAEAQFKIARASAIQNAPAYQPQQPPLQPQQQRVQSAPTAPAPRPDPRAEEWRKANTWFGSDEEMTSFALGLHQKLVKQGVEPDSDDYYGKLNKRLREVFPDQFTDEGEAEPPPPKDAKRPPATVVAPASRSSNAPKKITITKSQKALAEKLGITVQEYARQVQLLERNSNG